MTYFFTMRWSRQRRIFKIDTIGFLIGRTIGLCIIYMYYISGPKQRQTVLFVVHPSSLLLVSSSSVSAVRGRSEQLPHTRQEYTRGSGSVLANLTLPSARAPHENQRTACQNMDRRNPFCHNSTDLFSIIELYWK